MEEQIRKARLALICVGDPIYFITYLNKIVTYYVTDVKENAIRVNSGRPSYHPLYYFDIIDICEGNLYIWKYHIIEDKERFNKLIQIVKANERV